jgi:glycosyltransferase involved in cell wall biosynthesis
VNKLITIVTPTFNEGENINELYGRLSTIWKQYNKYDFELIVIDNASTDDTLVKLRQIAANDKRVKIIVNNRNYGHLRSPYWAMLQAHGDAVIFLASDLQDPPELIPELIEKWESGAYIVLGVKPTSSLGIVSHSLRKLYYRVLSRISTYEIIKDATGFGIYDKKIMDLIREIKDPYPYFRGLVCELGYPISSINFKQSKRYRGISKNNFYTLFDMAMMGIVSSSLVPIRIASFFGLIIGGGSIFLGIIFFLIKLIWWESIPFGIAPLVIILFFLIGTVMIFIGILGEYIASIIPYIKNRPIVVEKERINF